MPCFPWTSRDGKVRGIICSRSPVQLPPCHRCGRPATRLCDFRLPAPAGGAERTCDRPLCPACTRRVGRDTDYCDEHFRDPNQGLFLAAPNINAPP